MARHIGTFRGVPTMIKTANSNTKLTRFNEWILILQGFKATRLMPKGLGQDQNAHKTEGDIVSQRVVSVVMVTKSFSAI